MIKRILFADNDVDFLKIRKQFLEEQGYRVIPAIDPIEARRVLDRQDVDLALIDIRLKDDTDEKDISGLTLAKEAGPIPVIILTRFPTWEAVRDALGPNLDGLAPAVEFVNKEEGPDAMLRAIRKGFQIFSRSFRSTQDEIADQLDQDYKQARREARVHYWACLITELASAVVILIGAGLSLTNRVTVGVVSTTAGVVIGIMNQLLFSRLDRNYGRVDSFHAELIETKRFENVLAAADKVVSDQQKEVCVMQIIETAASNWFRSGVRKVQSSRPGDSDRNTKEVGVSE